MIMGGPKEFTQNQLHLMHKNGHEIMHENLGSGYVDNAHGPHSSLFQARSGRGMKHEPAHVSITLPSVTISCEGQPSTQ